MNIRDLADEGRQANIASRQKEKRSTRSNRLVESRTFSAVTVSIPWKHLVADNAKHAAVGVRTKGGQVKPRLILTAAYRSAKDAVEHSVRKIMGATAPTSESVELVARLYFPDLRKRDSTNYGKLIQDALSGIVYHDDAQIVVATYERAGIDRENPRCEVVVRPTTERAA